MLVYSLVDFVYALNLHWVHWNHLQHWGENHFHWRPLVEIFVWLPVVVWQGAVNWVQRAWCRPLYTIKLFSIIHWGTLRWPPWWSEYVFEPCRNTFLVNRTSPWHQLPYSLQCVNILLCFDLCKLYLDQQDRCPFSLIHYSIYRWLGDWSRLPAVMSALDCSSSVTSALVVDGHLYC